MAMDADRWRRLETLFERALCLPEASRAAFAGAEAGDDPVLLRELLAMIAVQGDASRRLHGALRSAAQAIEQAREPELAPGTRFGVWATDRLLGAGGMGQVYLGHRADGAYEREVAIKLLSGQALDARGRVLFEHECRILAQMLHPTIAQIHDAGTDDVGRPFLVMEYIQGRPITAWCSEHGMPLRARVDLFASVCEGVQHAHQKGVIHRDLKPGNVLVGSVDGRAMPKIIDFGIATETSRGGAIDSGGTPGYMSPEQARGDTDIDARSDVYSLGAMLYALVCGRHPEVGKALPPSRFLRTLPKEGREAAAEACGTTPSRLERQLEAGLDWIVLKAMCQNRAERYASVSSLIEDVHAWLTHRPPREMPRRRLLAARLLLRRHRLAFAVGTFALCALVTGLVTTYYALGQARNEAQRAQLAAEFLGSLLHSVDANFARGADRTLMLRVLDTASERAGRELSSRADVLAEVEFMIGRSLLSLNEYPRAIVHLERAHALAMKHPRTLADTIVESAKALGTAFTQNGQPDAAQRVLREAIAAAERQGSREKDVANMHMRLASALREQGRVQEALVESRAAYSEIARLLPADDAAVVDAGIIHAMLLSDTGDQEEAAALARAMIERWSVSHGEDDAKTLVLRQYLAVFLLRMNDFAAGARELKSLLEANIRLHGENSEYVLTARSNLAIALREQGELEEAGLQARLALEGTRARYGEDHYLTIMARHQLGNWHMAVGRPEEALRDQGDALASALRTLGEQHPGTALVLNGMAQANLALGRILEARRDVDRAMAAMDATGRVAEASSMRETLEAVEAAEMGLVQR